jgi:predicted proteasome-type protease
MFPIKILDKINEELYRYYLQIITFQNEDPYYQDIAAKFSKNLSELEDVIEDIKKYNNNKKNNPLIHIFK